MAHIGLTVAAAALALSLGTPFAHAQDYTVVDSSNSASATGSPFASSIGTTRGSITNIPGNRSSNPTDAAYASRLPVPETFAMAGVPNINWSNSASAVDSRQRVLSSTGSLLAAIR